MEVNGTYINMIFSALDSGRAVEKRLKGSNEDWEELKAGEKYFDFSKYEYRRKNTGYKEKKNVIY